MSMTFAEHLEHHRQEDGSYDLNAAEEDLAKELAHSPETIDALAAKAAKQARAAWERQETEKLRKQFQQSALSPDLELEVMVPLGNSEAVPLGDMNKIRIRLRKDLRTTSHLRELRAFEAEMTHWMNTETLIGDDETIAQAIARGL